MKIFIIRALVCAVWVTQIRGQNPDDPPDLTMLYEGRTSTCVATGNTIGSGLALMTPMIEQGNSYEFEYKYENGTEISTTYNCDFESESKEQCNKWAIWNDGRTEKSGIIHFPPVMDERWNQFKIYRTYYGKVYGHTVNHKYEKIEDLSDKSYIGISVRARDNSHIVLCDGNKPRSNKCYWIILDGFKNFNESLIRKCAKGVPDVSPAKENECTQDGNNITIKLLDESKWKHFLLEKDYDGKINQLLLWSWDVNFKRQLLLNYTDNNAFNTTQLFLRSLNTMAEWKVHQYKYVRFKHHNAPINNILITNNLVFNSPLCLSMYVGLCPHCEMTLKIIEDGGSEYAAEENIFGDQQQNFYMWKNVKLQNTATNLKKAFLLYASLKGTNGIWAIDDIRICSEKEFRVASANANTPLVCQSLQYPNWTFDSTQQYKGYANPPIQGNYIGLNHNISCTSLRKIEYCPGNKICLATLGKAACSCASYYTWHSDCTNVCDKGYYGYECKDECGKCKYDTCNVVTGECVRQLCEEGYIPPDCQKTVPYLVNPPQILKVLYTNATVVLNDISMNGDVNEVSKVQIQCQKTGYNTKLRDDLWFNCSDAFNDIRKGLEINIVNLEKETKYEIRAVVYTKNGIAFENKLPTTDITTMCKQLSENNIIISQTSRDATITFQTDTESCGINNYNYKYLLNGHHQYTNNKAEIFVSNLNPYTQYTLEISYNNERNITRLFWTEEDAPSKVDDLQCTSTQNEITIFWNEPKEKNGRIMNYLINYQLQKRSSCSQQIFTNSSAYITELSHTIDSLQPYTKYTITVVANTIKPGEGDSISCETLIDNSISEEEFPPSISIPHISSTYASFSFPYNCTSQRGPLFFQLVLQCVQDDWCNEIPSNITQNTEENIVNVHDLIPFVNYNVILQARRAKNGEFSTITRNTTFQTTGGIPGSVRNFDIYSKNQSSISVRWLEPWPPRGHLKNYNLKITNGRTFTIYKDKLQLCDLWDIPYYCYTFTGLKGNFGYTVSISAKNEEDDLEGTGISQSTRTEETSPTEPLNLTHNWQGDILNISWNHPNKTNGQLKYFIVHLFPNTTDLTNDDRTPYNYTYNVTEHKRTYTFSFNKTFRYSSSYTVTIYGMNSLKGDNATLYIDTPPEKPELSNNFRVERTTNSSIIINISGAKTNTRSKNSSLYVIVYKISGDSERNIPKIKEANDLLKLTTNNESWIAIEQQLSDTNLNITLGDGTKFSSREINTVQVFNKELEPNTEYKILVIPINRYRNQINAKEYSLTVRTSGTEIPTQGGIWALLLLLLLPVVGYFLYKHVYKKEDRRNSIMMMIPRLRPLQMGRSEDPHEPDVIPLTEAAGEPAQSRPKRPAVAPKPGPSKPPEDPPAEINPNGTNFFHSRIILLENLAEYLKEALDSKDLEEQHALFPRGQTKPWDYGTLKPNKFKNRYTNLIAYDHSRVKLEKINNDQYSDYINASYIHGYRQEKAYIATQGPKQATVNDFWRMIWQENMQYIVMLANVIEGGKRKCEKYWPEINSSREYGYIDVYFEKSELYADYEYRTFTLTFKKEKRTIYHLHFTSWPDHGVPMYPQSLVPFLKKILTIPQSTAPVVVHCSAGVGRTGTIILCDICLRMAAREKAVDVLRYLHEIREQRANMVDNSDQYKLVHMVLLECLLAPDTNIPCNAELSQSVQKLIEEGGLQIQLNYLQQSAWQDKALNFVEQKEQDPANNYKNRVPDIVPTENQVYITRFPVTDEYSDYINAVPIDGFRFKEQFIVTQLPMPNTVNDFWRMVSEKSVKTIVSLNDIPMNDTSCCQFWPNENEEMSPTPKISLKHHKIQIYDYYDVHTILLDDKLSQESFTVQIVQFKGWKHGSKLPQNEENLVLLWEETENLSHGNYPMIVTCYDGATASGMFVAMSFVIEKIKLEQQCDPCLAVRVIRRNRKQFVSNKTQFEFLYRSAVIYLSMFETYSNFQPVVTKPNLE